MANRYQLWMKMMNVLCGKNRRGNKILNGRKADDLSIKIQIDFCVFCERGYVPIANNNFFFLFIYCQWFWNDKNHLIGLSLSIYQCNRIHSANRFDVNGNQERKKKSIFLDISVRNQPVSISMISKMKTKWTAFNQRIEQTLVESQYQNETKKIWSYVFLTINNNKKFKPLAISSVSSSARKWQMMRPIIKKNKKKKITIGLR